MKSKRKSFKVRNGNSHITVSPWTHPSTKKKLWRIAYRPATGQPWKYLTRRTKEEAIAAAEFRLTTIANPQSLDELPPATRRWLEELIAIVPSTDHSRVLDYARSLAVSSELGSAIHRFISSKTSKAGEETPHMATGRRALLQFSDAFPGKHVSDIHLPALQSWFDERTKGLGWKRKKDIRGVLVSFYRWARREGITGSDAVTVAERLPEIGGEHGDRRIFTLQEYQAVQEFIAEEYRAWLVLGCFAGLRPEEVAPDTNKKKAAKRGLRCEEIDFQFGVIRVPACVSKVNLPRIVPLSAACRAGLQWAGIEPGMTGPVCLQNPSQKGALGRLAKEIFQSGWPKDICRHSYGSYRNAAIRDLGKLAEEMGTSVSMLHRHYHNPQAEADGMAWFNIIPGQPVLICSDETGGEPHIRQAHHF